jgi:hypothetical protein
MNTKTSIIKVNSKSFVKLLQYKEFCNDFNDVYNINQEGRNIYNTNTFLRSLTNVMENPEFAELFKNQFDSWDNIEIFLMFAKVYESITKQFPEMNGYEKIYLVKKFIDTSQTRLLICQEIRKFRNLKSIK